MRYNRSNISYLISKKFNENELALFSGLKDVGLKAIKKTSLNSITSDLRQKIGKKKVKYFLFVNKDSFSKTEINKFSNKLKEKLIKFEMVLFESEVKSNKVSLDSEHIELTLPRDNALGIQLVKKMIKYDLKIEVGNYLIKKFKDSNDKNDINKIFIDIMGEELELSSFGMWRHKDLKKVTGKVYCDSYIGRQIAVPQKYINLLAEKKSEILNFYKFGNRCAIQFSNKNSFLFNLKENMTEFEEEIIKESLILISERVKIPLTLQSFEEVNLSILKKVNVESGLENLLYDFRDVINTIKTVSHMFRSDAKESEFYTMLKGILLTSCDDLLFLIIDLMSEKYQEHLNIKPHKVDNISHYLKGKFKDVLRFYEINFNVDCENESVIECDGIKLKRAIGYLVNSSRKILVYEGIEKPIISIVFKEKKNSFLFEVKNNGPHFSKKDRVNFFEKMSFNENQEHSGLGFMIARKIVEEHDGTLDIRSGSEGTVFYMEIPKELKKVA